MLRPCGGRLVQIGRSKLYRVSSRMVRCQSLFRKPSASRRRVCETCGLCRNLVTKSTYRIRFRPQRLVALNQPVPPIQRDELVGQVRPLRADRVALRRPGAGPLRRGDVGGTPARRTLSLRTADRKAKVLQRDESYSLQILRDKVFDKILSCNHHAALLRKPKQTPIRRYFLLPKAQMTNIPYAIAVFIKITCPAVKTRHAIEQIHYSH